MFYLLLHFIDSRVAGLSIPTPQHHPSTLPAAPSQLQPVPSHHHINPAEKGSCALLSGTSGHNEHNTQTNVPPAKLWIYEGYHCNQPQERA